MADEKPHADHGHDEPQPKAEKAKTVTVTASQLHTHNGKTYHPGDTYEIDEAYASSVEGQGKAFRLAKPEAHAKKESHPVEAMTTEDLPPPKKHK